MRKYSCPTILLSDLTETAMVVASLCLLRVPYYDIVLPGSAGLELIFVSILLPCNRKFCLDIFINHHLLQLLFLILYLIVL